MTRDAFSKTKRYATLTGLVLLLLVSVIVSLGVGAYAITPKQVLAILSEPFGWQLPWLFDSGQRAVLASIRGPRIALGVLIGATLAISGAAMQGLFRNPLADPALIGVSSGAALAAVVAIVLETSLLRGAVQLFGHFYLPFAAFVGGFAVTWLVYRFASAGGRVDIASLLLAGIAVNALAGSLTGLFTLLADDQQLRTLTFWSMGSLGGANWSQVAAGLPLFLLNLLLLPYFSGALNALLLGEAEAGHLGFSVDVVKTAVIGLVALGVGACVAFSGIIGFIGLVVPHLLRLWLGPDHRAVLPGAALLGASLLLVSDGLARSLAVPAEIPIGIVTGVLGSPFFLWLLRRQRMIGG
ncbi:MAG: iron ABC transporter permease [Methylomicrobium sp.]